MRLPIVFLAVLSLAVAASALMPDFVISNCQVLGAPGVYLLDRDITAAGTCFTVAADNVVLSCGEHVVTGSGSGTAFDNSAGHDSVSVQNCVFRKFYRGVV
ncbi:MAG: hypothetical protein AB1626_04225 [Candidatus Micrarchaeota archaeon]